jgi:hypothetical protein
MNVVAMKKLSRAEHDLLISTVETYRARYGRSPNKIEFTLSDDGEMAAVLCIGVDDDWEFIEHGAARVVA